MNQKAASSQNGEGRGEQVGMAFDPETLEPTGFLYRFPDVIHTADFKKKWLEMGYKVSKYQDCVNQAKRLYPDIAPPKYSKEMSREFAQKLAAILHLRREVEGRRRYTPSAINREFSKPKRKRKVNCEPIDTRADHRTVA